MSVGAVELVWLVSYPKLRADLESTVRGVPEAVNTQRCEVAPLSVMVHLLVALSLVQVVPAGSENDSTILVSACASSFRQWICPLQAA